MALKLYDNQNSILHFTICIKSIFFGGAYPRQKSPRSCYTPYFVSATITYADISFLILNIHSFCAAPLELNPLHIMGLWICRSAGASWTMNLL
jgi:hypothetical protein